MAALNRTGTNFQQAHPRRAGGRASVAAFLRAFGAACRLADGVTCLADFRNLQAFCPEQHGYPKERLHHVERT
jgi:hypothetical protein